MLSDVVSDGRKLHSYAFAAVCGRSLDYFSHLTNRHRRLHEEARKTAKMRKMRLLLPLAGIVLLCVAATSGRFLVVDQPSKADAIMVLAGETDRRLARGLELLNQGYAPRMILNVPAGATIYQWTQLELAQRYVEGLPQAGAITICPIYGLSTKAEARDAARCLQSCWAEGFTGYLRLSHP
jgi:hypothetical protein